MNRDLIGKSSMMLWVMFVGILALGAVTAYADVDPSYGSGPNDAYSNQSESLPSVDSSEGSIASTASAGDSYQDSVGSSSTALSQFPKPEVSAYVAATPPPSHQASFPKVMSDHDAYMARKFSWWPSDAQPAPYKDPDRSGYWWWPQQPGTTVSETAAWGNQGYIYVRKLIFDYKTTEGDMKPSLVIKRILTNVKVYFDYDKAELRQDGIDALNKALYTLDKNLATNILISGNTDVRGSEKYNEKLGERRAAAVKQYLLDHNLPEDRIKILSRGKLDAMAPKNDIVGMQKDRNAQFMVAEVEEVMIPASQAHLFESKVIEEEQRLEGEVKVEIKEYVIQEGDSLWAIAKREYGNGMQWKRIYDFNKDVISNPDRPKKGTKIKLPIE